MKHSRNVHKIMDSLAIVLKTKIGIESAYKASIVPQYITNEMCFGGWKGWKWTEWTNGERKVRRKEGREKKRETKMGTEKEEERQGKNEFCREVGQIGKM